MHRYLFFKKRRKKYGIKDYRGQIRNRVSIESRPEIVAERSRFGDWEGDLIMAKNHKGAILTPVERRSKYLCVGEGCGSCEKWSNKVVARNECENDSRLIRVRSLFIRKNE